MFLSYYYSWSSHSTNETFLQEEHLGKKKEDQKGGSKEENVSLESKSQSNEQTEEEVRGYSSMATSVAIAANLKDTKVMCKGCVAIVRMMIK